MIFSVGLCRKLPAIKDGQSVLEPDKRTVLFKCNPGFVLNGSASLHCGNNGEWTGNEPLCESENSFLALRKTYPVFPRLTPH